MPTELRPNDIATTVAAITNFDTEVVILTAVQPVPTDDQEATVIIFTVFALASD